MRKKSKRLVALLLSLLLVISMIPTTGLTVEAAAKPKLAKKSVSIVVGGKAKYTWKSSNSPMATGDGTVKLKPTNEVRWIDRVELPDFALTLYETLEEAIDGDGYNDYLIDDKYFDLDREDVFSNSKPGDFIRRSETRTDGSVFRHASILVTTTASVEMDHDYISNCISAVHTAFKRDHPEAFWLQGKWQVHFYQNGVAYYCYALISKTVGKDEVTFDMRRPDFRSGGSLDIRRVMARCDEDIEKILRTIPTGADRFTQICYLNDWLVEHNSYNVKEGGYTPWYATQCISALEGFKGVDGPVCGGYTSAFKVLCDALDIPCVLVHTQEIFDPDHVWNYVQMENGEWYAVDVTWNDGGDNVANHTKWLLVGGKKVINGQEFLVSHPEENPSGYSGVANFTNGPALNNDAYPYSLHLSYMGMPEKLVSGNSVAMTPFLLCGANTAYIYSSTTLPAGLTLNPNTGEIIGTVTGDINALTVTVTVANPSDPADCAECTLKFPTVANEHH